VAVAAVVVVDKDCSMQGEATWLGIRGKVSAAQGPEAYSIEKAPF